MLEITAVAAAYGRIEVLHGVDLRVDAGEIVALIGANGAGKTTLMRCVSGLMPIKSGAIRFDGEDLRRCPAHRRVARGLVQSPEGRQVFTNLSVEDNLRLGGYAHGGALDKALLDEVFGYFPVLHQRLTQPAGTLSGGQQQMLAIARALMGRPRCLLLDEPSMGLAPMIVAQVMQVVAQLGKRGTSILLVEQNAKAALGIADRAYVMSAGKVLLDGCARDLIDDPRVRHAFLGH